MTAKVLPMETKEPATPSRGGAPPGNRSRMLHGLRADRSGTGLGSLPKGASYIRKQAGRFQRAIENDVRDSDGTISTYQSGRCQTASINRALASLALRWLRRESGDDGEGDRMPLADRLGLTKTISGLLEASDRALKDLGLDTKRSANPWAALDAPNAPMASDDTQHDETVAAAPAATSEPDKAITPDSGHSQPGRPDLGETNDDQNDD